MPAQKTTAAKIITSIKGLSKQLQTDEEPLKSIPAIWDDGRQAHSTPCDVIITNQRLLGYYLVNWPRERLFLDELALCEIKAVSLRQKKYEPVFRELMISTEQRKVYIRAPRSKIEALYSAIYSAIERYASASDSSFATGETAEPLTSAARPATIFGRQEINTPFETSPLAITLLFTGGLLVEILGIILWIGTQSVAIGTPLLLAGLVSVMAATLLRRRIN